jgi:hypothetical protein
LDAFDVENSGTCLTTDDLALFVTDPTVTVVVSILERKYDKKLKFDNKCLSPVVVSLYDF